MSDAFASPALAPDRLSTAWPRSHHAVSSKDGDTGVLTVRKRLKLETSMHGILQILSLTLFEKTPLDQLLTLAVEDPKPPNDANQLILFE